MVTEEGSMKPFEEQTIVEKLRIRAEIRRKIKRRPDGTADRIADLCEEAASTIEQLTTVQESVLKKLDVDEIASRSKTKEMGYGAFGEPCHYNVLDYELFAKNIINEYLSQSKS